MEEVYTSQTFANIFTLGMVKGREGPIPTHVDEVAHLELFTVEKQRKQVIREMHKWREINLDSEMVLTTKTMMMDIKRSSLKTTVTNDLAIAQDNVHKAIDVEKKMMSYKDKISLL
jgi:hypothetical protein